MATIVGKKRTTLYLDGELHRKLNIAAVSMVPKRSMSEIVESLMRQFLDSGTQDLEKALTPNSARDIKVN